jgi:uncharacterized protein YciI
MPLERCNMKAIISTLLAFAVLAIGGSPVAQPADPSPKQRDIRFVVIHVPGPNWLAGKTLFEQPGVREHVEHYGKLLGAGKLQMGGPYLDAKGGGMMIPAAGVSEAELRAFAADDPAVKSGVLVAEVRPWLIGMSQ